MPSSGRASGNRSTPPKMSPRLPSRTQVALPSYQSAPSTSISASNAVGAQVARPAPQVRGAADPLLEVVGVADHRRVEARRRPSRRSAPRRSGRRRAAPVAPEPDGDGALDVLRDPEVRREQVRRAGRDDRELAPRAGEHVDAAPHRPVAAPREHELGALVQRAARPARAPSWPSAPRTRADPPRPPPRARGAARAARRRASSRRGRRRRPSCDRLPPRDVAPSARAGSAPPAATPAARHANSSTSSAPIPTTSPPATSSGWCMPRYMRDARDDDRQQDRERPRQRRARRASGSAT